MLFGTFCNICWIWTRYKQTRYLIDRAILGKMGGVYVTYVADVDKGIWPVVTVCVKKLQSPQHLPSKSFPFEVISVGIFMQIAALRDMSLTCGSIYTSNIRDPSISPIQCSTAMVKQGPGRARGPRQELTAGTRLHHHCHLLRLHLRPSWGSAVSGRRRGSTRGSSRPWPAVEARPTGCHREELLRSYANR